MSIKSLKSRNSNLANGEEQLKVLNGAIFAPGNLPTFKDKLVETKNYPLIPTGIQIFQVNVGYMCNQTCKHCHVDAGPDRKEIMTRETMQLCLDVYEKYQFPTVDLTGGAPEMNPDFRWFVKEFKKRGAKEIIVRCNLTIILANKSYLDLPQFFRENNVRVVSSLPFYQSDRTDRQRGEGVFNKSLQALKLLNEAGYGVNDSGLILDLVYNPSGTFLPADQKILEADFKRELYEHQKIVFNSLLCITNLPISRFLEHLINTDNLEDYMSLLVRSFNPSAVKGVMCRNTISIGWDGFLYDCDFNQMLGMKITATAGRHIKDFDLEKLNKRSILINQHCYGCTAGAGSSCQGAVVSK